MHRKKPILRHFRQHRHRDGQEDRADQDNEKTQAFERQPPPIGSLDTPGLVGGADQCGEETHRCPNQHEKCEHTCLPARFDDTGDSIKNGALHFTIKRDKGFNVSNDLCSSPVPINKSRSHRDDEDNQRKQREERVVGERCRRLGAVHLGKLFHGKTEYGPSPAGFLIRPVGRCSRLSLSFPPGVTHDLYQSQNQQRYCAHREKH